MSNFRGLEYLKDGDYFSYEKRIYKVDWGLEEPYNVILAKTGEKCCIEEYTRVKWLRNYKNFKIV